MRNVLIIGSGRSGSSMVAGSLIGANKCFAGGNLYPIGPTTNPRGFYESRTIAHINERLLAPAIEPLVTSGQKNRQRWLGVLEDLDQVGIPAPDDDEKIRKLAQNTPFCFKDPRFAYTLHRWREYLEEATPVFVCIFRNPATTADSMCRFCKKMKALKSATMDFMRALEIWACVYRHILVTHSKDGCWAFLNYDQMFNKKCRTFLADLIDGQVDHSFPDLKYSRSGHVKKIPENIRNQGRELCEEVDKLYTNLCQKAGYDPTAYAEQIDG